MIIQNTTSLQKMFTCNLPAVIRDHCLLRMQVPVHGRRQFKRCGLETDNAISFIHLVKYFIKQCDIHLQFKATETSH